MSETNTNTNNETETTVENYGLPKTVMINGKEKSYDIDVIVTAFNAKMAATGKMPGNISPGYQHIICTKSGAAVTCYGSNLHSKITKYGGLFNLLTTFVSPKFGGGPVMRTGKTVQTVDVGALQAQLAALEAENKKLKGDGQTAEAAEPEQEETQDDTLALGAGESQLALPSGESDEGEQA